MYGYTYPKKMFLLGYFGTFYLLLQNMVYWLYYVFQI